MYVWYLYDFSVKQEPCADSSASGSAGNSPFTSADNIEGFSSKYQNSDSRSDNSCMLVMQDGAQN